MSGSKSFRRSPLWRSKPALATWTTSLTALVITAYWLIQRAPADPGAVPVSIDQAIAVTTKITLANPAAPRDLATLQEVVAVAWPFFFPDLGLAVRRQDPAFVAAEAAGAGILDPGGAGAELMKDPAAAAELNSIVAAFKQGAQP